MNGQLLAEVQRSLCCPDGECRAIKSGLMNGCGAGATKAHAKAAIDICQRNDALMRLTLMDIRKRASAMADREGKNFAGAAFREISSLAQRALE